jgi:hypothetical protein
MTRRKTFNASMRNRQREPLIVELIFDRYSGPTDEEGLPLDHDNDEYWTPETVGFKCKGWLPAYTLLRFGDTWDKERGDISLEGMTAFFETVMGDKEFGRFVAFLHANGESILFEASELAGISQWVFQELGGRPTGRSSESSSGPSPTGNGSTGSAPSPELTPPS